MDGKFLEIEGRKYDLENPEERKAAVRAWLQAKAKERLKVRPSGETPEAETVSNHSEEEGEENRTSW